MLKNVALIQFWTRIFRSYILERIWVSFKLVMTFLTRNFEMDQSDFLSQSRTRLSDDLLPQYTESFRMLWTKIDQNINFLVLFII